MIIGNPRGSSRYAEAARAYINARRRDAVACALCGQAVDMEAPPLTRWSPSIEHQLPVREIRRIARSYAEAVDIACDQSMWAVAHKICQDRQGAQAVNTRRRATGTPSRTW